MGNWGRETFVGLGFVPVPVPDMEDDNPGTYLQGNQPNGDAVECLQVQASFERDNFMHVGLQ